MSFPALRQPKVLTAPQVTAQDTNNNNCHRKILHTEIQNLIITLKEGTKLVVTRDAYNGIITAGDLYKCLFCAAEMELDNTLKEIHVTSQKHQKTMGMFQFSDEFPGNMIRQINAESFYCTVCNVPIAHHFITRHLTSEIHKEKLEKAVKKAIVYKPIK